MSFINQLEKYAELAIKTAVNIQPGQSLWINAPIHTPEFVRMITEHAYKAGAKLVHIEWQDEISTQIKYHLAPDEAFEEYPLWRAQAVQQFAENGGAFLFIESSNPELLKGVDPKRVAANSKAAGTALAKWREYMSANKMTWSIIGVPSTGWAKLVFPDLDADAAVQALWEAIFKASRVDQDNPVQAWQEHNATLHDKRAYLNSKQYKKLHYRAPGTDLTIELPENHIWSGGTAVNEAKNPFNPNVPTEEVFTSPHREGTHGVVRSSKPLSYQGNLIENFSLTFEDGKVIDFEAEKGYESLKAMLGMDEAARYLGEAALVPHHSPISESNLIFFNTLYDENASNHLALGSAFPTCLEGGLSMSREELDQAGLNHSIIHVDFMIGSAEMDIDGITQDGQIEPVFRNGNWAF
ncbi:aminopeptidase AmpS [Paenibacillus sp. J23TS9]|uniref:aminopeptidase n=1 Tax=Paenibacillus sp. J23TS9 TaxID=2807193 RepID=UPI001B079043|nr:aminopeptidase [Paenibacillus sp. J23TS9]GIP28382.1 aminopeptidase AmpS [Paenibacillus sp. J23TS9]